MNAISIAIRSVLCILTVIGEYYLFVYAGVLNSFSRGAILFVGLAVIGLIIKVIPMHWARTWNDIAYGYQVGTVIALLFLTLFLSFHMTGCV